MIPANLLSWWARSLCSTLAQLGVRHLVISPGSRSTPFVIAALDEPAFECHVVVDERSAGFFALGIARTSVVPPVLLCTSGSAAAHYLPAVIEADESGLPLFLLTADRPPELQQCAAAQTSRHRQFFGDFLREAVDLGVPEASEPAFLALRRKLAQSFAAATGVLPGPVHVNAPARKPLEPKAATTPEEHAFERNVEQWLAGPVPRCVRAGRDPSAEDLDAILSLVSSERRGVVIAGPTSEPHVRESLERFARQVGYPLLAETVSQARFGPAIAGVVRAPHFELAWRGRSAREALTPRVAIVVGQTPTSAAWENLAAASGVTLVTVSNSAWSDPASRARWLVRGPVVASLDAMVRRLEAPLPADPRWLEDWQRTEARCASAVDLELASWPPDSEGRAVRAVMECVPDDANLFVGNSLAIRDGRHLRSRARPRSARPVAAWPQRHRWRALRSRRNLRCDGAAHRSAHRRHNLPPRRRRARGRQTRSSASRVRGSQQWRWPHLRPLAARG